MLSTTTSAYEAAICRARLLPNFKFLGCKQFQCKNLKNNIAQFEHLPTGLIFNLIPGGKGVRPFLLAQTPCTQDAWASRVRNAEPGQLSADPSSFHNSGLESLAGLDLPVESVSWLDVQAWLALEDDGLRLPYEQEWEHACRAGSTSKFYFGSSEKELGDYAWYSENSGSRTHPVGQKKPNAFGLHDMSGLVWEWCEDDWQENVQPVPYAYSDDFDDVLEDQSEYPFVGSQTPESLARSASSGAAAGSPGPCPAGPRTATGTGRRTATSTSASASQGQSDPFVESQTSEGLDQIASSVAAAGSTWTGSAAPRTATGACPVSSTSTSASASQGQSDPFAEAPSLSETARTASAGAVAGGAGPGAAGPRSAAGPSRRTASTTSASAPRGLSSDPFVHESVQSESIETKAASVGVVPGTTAPGAVASPSASILSRRSETSTSAFAPRGLSNGPFGHEPSLSETACAASTEAVAGTTSPGAAARPAATTTSR